MRMVGPCRVLSFLKNDGMFCPLIRYGIEYLIVYIVAIIRNHLNFNLWNHLPIYIARLALVFS